MHIFGCHVFHDLMVWLEACSLKLVTFYYYYY